MHIHLYIHIYVHICMYVNVLYMYTRCEKLLPWNGLIYTHIHVHRCTYIYTYIFMYIYACMSMYYTCIQGVEIVAVERRAVRWAFACVQSYRRVCRRLYARDQGSQWRSLCIHASIVGKVGQVEGGGLSRY